VNHRVTAGSEILYAFNSAGIHATDAFWTPVRRDRLPDWAQKCRRKVKRNRGLDH
jgi:hypothetical protein